MKRVFAFLLLLFTCCMVNAEKWDKTTMKLFRNEKVYGLVVDMSNAKMADLDSAKFVVCIAGKEGKTYSED